MESRFLICSCFFYKHIFLQRYRIHVDFHQEQFTRDYGKVSSVRHKTYTYVASHARVQLYMIIYMYITCVTQMLKERGCDENDFSVILQDVSIYARTRYCTYKHAYPQPSIVSVPL